MKDAPKRFSQMAKYSSIFSVIELPRKNKNSGLPPEFFYSITTQLYLHACANMI